MSATAKTGSSPPRCSAARCTGSIARPACRRADRPLAYKPQFGVLIPIALLAGGRWRTIGAAAATVAALVAVSFGYSAATSGMPSPNSMNFTQTVVLEQGGTGCKRSSRFSRRCGRGARASRSPTRCRPHCSPCSPPPRLAVARRCRLRTQGRSAGACGSLLATPYVLDYDLVMLAVAIAFFARHGLRHGFRDFEISLLAAVWIVPLLSRSIAGATYIPLGLLGDAGTLRFRPAARGPLSRTTPGRRARHRASVI